MSFDMDESEMRGWIAEGEPGIARVWSAYRVAVEHRDNAAEKTRVVEAAEAWAGEECDCSRAYGNCGPCEALLEAVAALRAARAEAAK